MHSPTVCRMFSTYWKLQVYAQYIYIMKSLYGKIFPARNTNHGVSFIIFYEMRKWYLKNYSKDLVKLNYGNLICQTVLNHSAPSKPYSWIICFKCHDVFSLGGWELEWSGDWEAIHFFMSQNLPGVNLIFRANWNAKLLSKQAPIVFHQTG